MAKKKSTSKHHAYHEVNAKAVLSFFLFLVAVVVLYVFVVYQNSILVTNPQLFFVLVVGLFALLVGLLYLINKPHSK